MNVFIEGLGFGCFSLPPFFHVSKHREALLCFPAGGFCFFRVRFGLAVGIGFRFPQGKLGQALFRFFDGRALGFQRFFAKEEPVLLFLAALLVSSGFRFRLGRFLAISLDISQSFVVAFHFLGASDFRQGFAFFLYVFLLGFLFLCFFFRLVQILEMLRQAVGLSVEPAAIFQFFQQHFRLRRPGLGEFPGLFDSGDQGFFFRFDAYGLVFPGKLVLFLTFHFINAPHAHLEQLSQVRELLDVEEFLHDLFTIVSGGDEEFPEIALGQKDDLAELFRIETDFFFRRFGHVSSDGVDFLTIHQFGEGGLHGGLGLAAAPLLVDGLLRSAVGAVGLVA